MKCNVKTSAEKVDKRIVPYVMACTEAAVIVGLIEAFGFGMRDRIPRFHEAFRRKAEEIRDAVKADASRYETVMHLMVRKAIQDAELECNVQYGVRYRSGTGLEAAETQDFGYLVTVMVLKEEFSIHLAKKDGTQTKALSDFIKYYQGTVRRLNNTFYGHILDDIPFMDVLTSILRSYEVPDEFIMGKVMNWRDVFEVPKNLVTAAKIEGKRI